MPFTHWFTLKELNARVENELKCKMHWQYKTKYMSNRHKTPITWHTMLFYLLDWKSLNIRCNTRKWNGFECKFAIIMADLEFESDLYESLISKFATAKSKFKIQNLNSHTKRLVSPKRASSKSFQQKLIWCFWKVFFQHRKHLAAHRKVHRICRYEVCRRQALHLAADSQMSRINSLSLATQWHGDY